MGAGGGPLTADTISDVDLCALFGRHCACRPIDLHRAEDDHAAIHNCDTAILHNVQITERQEKDA